MKGTVFEIVSIISFVLSFLFFSAAVFVFFKFKIPGVIGYLTGSTARKKIREMQKKEYNDKTGELTGKKVKTDKLVTGSNKNIQSGDAETSQTTVLEDVSKENNTTVLDNSAETTVLYNNNMNTVVYDYENDVKQKSGTTQTLNKSDIPHTPQVIEYNGEVSFDVEQEIVFVHTNEVIH